MRNERLWNKHLTLVQGPLGLATDMPDEDLRCLGSKCQFDCVTAGADDLHVEEIESTISGTKSAAFRPGWVRSNLTHLQVAGDIVSLDYTRHDGIDGWCI